MIVDTTDNFNGEKTMHVYRVCRDKLRGKSIGLNTSKRNRESLLKKMETQATNFRIKISFTNRMRIFIIKFK